MPRKTKAEALTAESDFTVKLAISRAGPSGGARGDEITVPALEAARMNRAGQIENPGPEKTKELAALLESAGDTVPFSTNAQRDLAARDAELKKAQADLAKAKADLKIAKEGLQKADADLTEAHGQIVDLELRLEAATAPDENTVGKQGGA